SGNQVSGGVKRTGYCKLGERSQGVAAGTQGGAMALRASLPGGPTRRKPWGARPATLTKSASPVAARTTSGVPRRLSRVPDRGNRAPPGLLFVLAITTW